MVEHLHAVGVTEIFIYGSIAEGKRNPNDIDGYFACDRDPYLSGELHQRLQALGPLRTFAAQIGEEIPSYESLKRGEFAELKNLQRLGQMLIDVRFALGLPQRDLAVRLDVRETQVSRDERNEYFGVTLKYIDALNPSSLSCLPKRWLQPGDVQVKRR